MTDEHKKFSRSKPEGHGLMSYLEKGEVLSGRSAAGSGQPDTEVIEVEVGPDNRLNSVPALEKKLGLEPGARLEFAVSRGRIEVLPNIHSLNRLYVEPTARCNLTCRTCIRNTWEEPMGDMDPALFDRLAGWLGRFPHLESVMFAGFGEPLTHPDIVPMVRKVKELGLRAELTTNGTMLDEPMLRALLESRLDVLWVSIDGTSEESYADIRPGGGFGRVIENLERVRRLNDRDGHTLETGIAFVLTRTNIDDVGRLERMARSLGARWVMVSHVLPYTEAMEKEMLCLQTLTLETFAHAPGRVEVILPRMDMTPFTRDAVFALLQGYENLTIMRNKMSAETRRCRFIQERTTFVRWDGLVAPCMGLLHSHRTYLYGLERRVRSHSFGDIRTDDLDAVWASPAYREFREKVRKFDFSPCHVCGGCSLLEKNEEDCYGNTFPTCGGCLWAQGVVQCP